METDLTESAALARIEGEDAVGMLLAARGRMAELATENGTVMLDWVTAVPRLLDDPHAVERVEAEAVEYLRRGIRHVIWCGMGGSVMAVRVLTALLPGTPRLTIHPLDSTDPAALTAVLGRVAAAERVSLSEAGDEPGTLRALLEPVLVVGVAMGMTSEEPITHLRWFVDLLAEAGLPVAEHSLVLALPRSFLDTFGREAGLPSLPLQLDGGCGTPGRMSAPGTRVFLLPAAFLLRGGGRPAGTLRDALRQGWEMGDFAGARRNPGTHRWVCLAAALAGSAAGGRLGLMVDLADPWQAVYQWIEQLLEESLGKGGRGIVVFGRQEASEPHVFHLSVGAGTEPRSPYHLDVPVVHGLDAFPTLVAHFLGWELCMALYGYLHGIQFAGQPAVELYKARARELREGGDPLRAAGLSPARARRVTALLPGGSVHGTRAVGGAIRDLWREAAGREPPRYVDVTFNGDLDRDRQLELGSLLRSTVNLRLGVPFKLRRAPAAYHSTEQSEMDGPPGMVSVRLVTTGHEIPIRPYSDTFLLAQAVGTWQAMVEANRPCCLLVGEGALAKAWPGFAAGLRAGFGANGG